MLKALTHYWWVFLLRGIFGILFGLGAFLWPSLTLAVLLLLFGAYALADGVMSIVSMFSHRSENDRWWLHMIEGAAGIGAGLVTFFWPGLTAFALLFIIAAWSIMTGICEVIVAVRLREELQGEWALILSGLLSVAFGLLLVARPGTGALAVTWMIGAYAVAFGFLLIVLSLRLKKMGEVPEATAQASA